MKKLMVMGISLLLAVGVLAGCGKSSGAAEEKEVAVEDILQAVQEAYGENYLPDTEMDAAMLEESYGIDPDLMESFVAERPMIGFHPDCVIIAKAAEGKGDDLEAAFTALQKRLIEDSFIYPVNLAKTESSQVVRNGDYVAFFLVGASNDDMDASEEEQLKFAQEETKKAVDAFESFFQ